MPDDAAPGGTPGGDAGRAPTAGERLRWTGQDLQVRMLAFLRQLPYRPATAAGVTGVVLGAVTGFVGSGWVAYPLAVVVGLVLQHRRAPLSLPLSGPGLQRRTLPLVGRVLVGLFFFLPVSTGLVLPSVHNPDTITKYVSILVTIPSNLVQVSTPSVHPGVPVVVLASLALVVVGSLHARRRRHFLAIVTGFVLYLLSPTISGVVTGDAGLHLDPGVHRVGLYVALVGVVVLAVSRRAGATPEGGTAAPPPPPTSPPPVAGVALLVPLASVLAAFGDEGWLWLSFESTHHTLAAIIAGGLAGTLGLATVSEEAEQTQGAVSLTLLHPAGHSPNVFVTGWLFGARCVVDPGTDNERDVSDEVRWSGTGTFAPDVGRTSRPTFDGPGANTITLRWGSTTIDVPVSAIESDGFAAVGTNAKAPADGHGCLACPHSTIGPIVTGSPTVLVNGRPAARVGDTGTHAACCGPNSFRITGGQGHVLIDGRPAARIGDATAHCGGAGSIVG